MMDGCGTENGNEKGSGTVESFVEVRWVLSSSSLNGVGLWKEKDGKRKRKVLFVLMPCSWL